MLKQRYQNPVVGDTIRLRLFTYSSNNLDNVQSVEKVEVYQLDPSSITTENPDGRVLKSTLTAVINEDTGKYYVDVDAIKPLYVIGNYIDIWTVQVEDDQEESEIKNEFTIYPKLWYTTTIPIIYDFGFDLQPNRITKGSKKFLRIQILPMVPQATALERYYTNLAISANLKINIARKCDPCAPQELDLRTIVEDEDVEEREKVFGYYQLNTEDLDCGLYDVWFKLEFGDSIYVSEKQQLLIY